MHHELMDHFRDPGVEVEIESRRLGWVDHIWRRSKESLLKEVMKGVIVGRRLVERIKARWWYQVRRYMTTTGKIILTNKAVSKYIFTYPYLAKLL